MRNTDWHAWFAWHPVRVADRWGDVHWTIGRHVQRCWVEPVPELRRFPHLRRFTRGRWIYQA